jgi:hypothetical protein
MRLHAANVSGGAFGRIDFLLGPLFLGWDAAGVSESAGDGVMQ